MIVPVSELRARFETADRPNQKDFVDLIDTLLTQAAGTVTPEMLAAGGARTMLINNPSNQTLWAALSLATLKSSFVAVATNSGNDYTIDVNPAPAAHADLEGVPLMVRMPANNTGNVQFRAHSSLGLKKLLSNTGQELGADDLTANQVILVTFNSALDSGNGGAYQAIGVLGVDSSTPPSGSAGGDLSGSYPSPSIGAGKVVLAHLANDSVNKDKLLAGGTEAAGKVLGLVVGGGGLELSWVDDQNTGGGGGSSGGATNYFNLVTTPTVLASGTTTYPTTYTQIAGSTLAAAGVPVGAAFALVEIYLKNGDSTFELWAQSASGAPELLLARNVSDYGSAGPQGISVQAMIPLHSDRSFYYKFIWTNAGSGQTHNWAVKLIGYYSPGIAAAGTQTTVFLSSQVELTSALASGESTFDLRTPGYVPALATAAVLCIKTDGAANATVEGQPFGGSAWLLLHHTGPDYAGNSNISSVQVTVPLSADGRMKLKRTLNINSNTTQVLLQGYLLPGTTAAPIQSGTASVNAGGLYANKSVITHGLGYVPPHVRLVLRCITDELGYVAGDEIPLENVLYQATTFRAFDWLVTANTVEIWRVDNVTYTPAVLGKTSSTQAQITLAKWELKAYWARVDGVIPGNLAGVVKQMLQAVKTTSEEMTASDGTWSAISGLSQTITLNRATNKVRAQAVVHLGGVNNYQNPIRLVRTVGGTPTVIGINTDTLDAGLAGCNAGAIASAYSIEYTLLPTVIDFIDTPGAVGPVTYHVEVRRGVNATKINKTDYDTNAAYGRGRTVSVLTLTEVAV